LNQLVSSVCTAFGFFSSTDARTASRSTISPGIWLLSNSVCAPRFEHLRAIGIERHGSVDLALSERRGMLVRFQMHHGDFACSHATDGQSAAQDERTQRPAFDRHPLAAQILHRAHAGAAYDNIGSMRHIHDRHHFGLQFICGENEQLVQADDHPVDRLVAKGT
jgi:hypothetical protein